MIIVIRYSVDDPRWLLLHSLISDDIDLVEYAFCEIIEWYNFRNTSTASEYKAKLIARIKCYLTGKYWVKNSNYLGQVIGDKFKYISLIAEQLADHPAYNVLYTQNVVNGLKVVDTSFKGHDVHIGLENNT